MALTGLIDNTKFIRLSKPATITGASYADDKLVTEGRYIYQPLQPLDPLDESSQIATTKFVSDYRQKRIDANVSIVLETNRYYTLTVNQNTTLTLPPPQENTNNEIVVDVVWVSGTLNYGTDYFLDEDAVSFGTNNTRGTIYYDYNPQLKKWGCGIVCPML